MRRIGAQRRSYVCASRRRGRPREADWPAVSIHVVTFVSAGPPLGVLYLKPPSSGGLWDGVITMPSANPVVRRGCSRGWRATRPASACTRRRGEHDVHAIGREHFHGGGACRLRQRVRVDAEKERTVDERLATVLDDGLADRDHVSFIEAPVERVMRMRRGKDGAGARAASASAKSTARGPSTVNCQPVGRHPRDSGAFSTVPDSALFVFLRAPSMLTQSPTRLQASGCTPFARRSPREQRAKVEATLHAAR